MCVFCCQRDARGEVPPHCCHFSESLRSASARSRWAAGARARSGTWTTQATAWGARRARAARSGRRWTGPAARGRRRSGTAGAPPAAAGPARRTSATAGAGTASTATGRKGLRTMRTRLRGRTGATWRCEHTGGDSERENQRATARLRYERACLALRALFCVKGPALRRCCILHRHLSGGFRRGGRVFRLSRHGRPFRESSGARKLWAGDPPLCSRSAEWEIVRGCPPAHIRINIRTPHHLSVRRAGCPFETRARTAASPLASASTCASDLLSPRSAQVSSFPPCVATLPWG